MKFAFLFPGQGSQSVGMMSGFADMPVIRQTFDEASEILKQDLWKMVTEPNEELNQTANTQPLMLTAGVATWRAWQQSGGEMPNGMAGHSLGEYTALVAAEAMSFQEALPLVRYRAEVMQSAVAEGEGAMAAVLGLEDEAVREVCAASAQGQVLEAVNFNSPGQVVIAGNKAAVERGIEAAKVKGAKRALILPVSVPSHCALMRPAAGKLQQYLEQVTVNAPAVPVLHNADIQAHSDAKAIKGALVRQLYSPVLWVGTIQKMYKDGLTTAAECGPGKVLAGLNKRIVVEMPCSALISVDALAEFKNQQN